MHQMLKVSRPWDYSLGLIYTRRHPNPLKSSISCSKDRTCTLHNYNAIHLSKLYVSQLNLFNLPVYPAVILVAKLCCIT